MRRPPFAPDRPRAEWELVEWYLRHSPSLDHHPARCPIDGAPLQAMERAFDAPPRFVHWFGAEHSDWTPWLQAAAVTADV